MLFPWSKLFPENLTSKIIYHMASLKRLSHRSDESRRFYVLKMIKILEKIYRKYQDKKTFIVVGHSLGGGLAKLSGIALNFTDVLISVSGPGITHAHATVDQTKDVPMETINRRIFNIYHDRDLVPWIDKQEGLIQIVTCPSEFKRLQCHYVTPLFCQVVRICGNPRGFKVNPNICIP
jgi:putative lipase involved disintegration of autophagic bodies